MRTKLLIVEDQFIEANNMKLMLMEVGYSIVAIVGSVSKALDILRQETPDLVMLDICLEGERTGIDLARLLRERHIPFVYLSANSDRAILEKAKDTEPYGFLVKPYRKKDVLVMLEIALYLHKQRMAFGLPLEPRTPIYDDEATPMIGQSTAIKEVLKKMAIVGPSEVSALVLGESGTGKELVAEGIHRMSARKDKPLVIVNCAVLPANLIESELFGHEKGAFTGAVEKRIGKFEQADDGTIFLDEIGELPPNLQAKFLRVLQSKEIEPIGGKSRKVNVRIISATNRNLEEEIAAGRFRMDLYYRLNVFSIEVPPLHQRRDDIPLLAHHFLKKFCQQEGRQPMQFSDEVLKAMTSYHWPGNVREMENFVARSVLLNSSAIIDSCDLPVEANKAPRRESGNVVKTMTELERDHILDALTHCSWKLHGKGGAAQLLQINASTLRSRMKKLGIEKKFVDHSGYQQV